MTKKTHLEHLRLNACGDVDEAALGRVSISVSLAVVRLSTALMPKCCGQVLTAHVLFLNLSL